MALAALTLAGARGARGDEPAIVPDRPGFGESASAVSPGRVQLETGGDWLRLDADTTSLDGPEALLRVGLWRGVELRVVAPDQSLTSPSFSIGRSLGEHVATFVEYGADLGHGTRPLHKLDNGYTWVRGGRTQLDAEVGIFLSSAAPEFFVGAGFSHLF